MPLECHTLTMNTIELQPSDAAVDISMLQCSAKFRILFINSRFMADIASHKLASTATVIPTLNVEEGVVIILNGWTPKKKELLAHARYMDKCESTEEMAFCKSLETITSAADTYNALNKYVHVNNIPIKSQQLVLQLVLML